MSEYIVDVGDADEEYVAYFKRKAEMMMGNPFREEIIRCRDCRHYHVKINGCDEFGDIWHDEYANVEPDGFCAWSERRDV